MFFLNSKQMLQIHLNVLEKNELEYFNNLVNINKEFLPSTVGFGETSELRNSTQIDISNDPVVECLTNRILNQVFKEKDYAQFNYEANIIKYEIGQKNGLHHDEADWDDNGNLQEMYEDETSFRKYSLIIFLSDNYQGGILNFPKLNLNIYPKIGKMVIFKNVNDNLTINSNMIHESLEITQGCKIVLVIFVSVEKPIFI